MQINSEAYQSHGVFADLTRYISFYKSLTMSIFLFPTMGTKSIANIDSYTYSSMHGTLESIQTILLSGRINDAYCLLRKYYDSAVIDIYTKLNLAEHFSIQNFVVEEIQSWLTDKVQLPQYGMMLKYIANAQMAKPITSILSSDNRYKSIRDRSNAHTHYNFYQHVLLNDNKVSLPNRMRWLDTFKADAQDLLVIHLGYVFFLKDHYMMSSDYTDSLECGVQPEPDSQYWVAPFVQEMFDEVISPRRAEITATIKGSSAMQLT